MYNLTSVNLQLTPALVANFKLSLGLIAKTVGDAAEQTGKVIQDARPIASTTVQSISSADPTTIAVSGGALVLAYFLLPPVVFAISFNFCGYEGDFTPAQVLDLVSSNNYTLIDIRSENEKDKSGVPRLPSSAKNKMIAIPLEELPSKLKGLVRNTKKLEAEIAATKISYLKKINKGSKIVILDSKMSHTGPNDPVTGGRSVFDGSSTATKEETVDQKMHCPCGSPLKTEFMIQVSSRDTN